MTFQRATLRLRGDSSPARSGDEVLTLPELVRFNATKNSDRLFCLQEEKGKIALREITYRQLSVAVDNCALAMNELLPKPHGNGEEDGQLGPVALFLESGVDLFVHLVALLSVGIPVVLLSARLSANSVEHLIRETKARHIITSERLCPKISGLPGDLVKVHFASPIVASGPCSEHHAFELARASKNGCNAVILHSSGTTGLPKAIRHSQDYLLRYAACHEFGPDEDVSGVNVSTLPLYHGFGLLAPTLSLSVGKPCCFPLPTRIPTADTALALLKRCAAKSLMTVPSILEDLSVSDDKDCRRLLSNLDFVAVGGGPMKTEVAERVTLAGIKLLNHFGATELGPLAPIFKPGPDYDWRYLRLRQDISLQLVPTETDEKEDATFYQLVGKSTMANTDEWKLADRLVLRPGTTRDVRILSRNDDVIVLSNGEKVMPQTLELALSAVPGVKTAFAFGDGHFEIGVLIERAEKAATAEEDYAGAESEETLKARIWQETQRVNLDLDAHARVLDPAAISILPAGTTLPRSDKGSVMRAEANRTFEAEISAVYQRLEDAASGDSSGWVLDVKDLQSSLHQLLEEYLPISRSWGYSDDLFEFGLDSLCAARMQRQIGSQLSRIMGSKTNTAMTGFVYRFPTIDSMAAQIQHILAGKTGDDGSAEFDTRPTQALLQEFSESLAVNSVQPKLGYVVLLTGSTGSIGTHLLNRLLRDPSVEHVICLDRPQVKGHGDMDSVAAGEEEDGARDGVRRQRQAFFRQGLEIPPADLWSKITAIATHTREHNLGLPVLQYRGLLHSVTHVIHNAWPMDFHRSVTSFRGQLASLRNLLQLCIDASTLSSEPTRFIFNSSIAVLANYAGVSGRQQNGDFGFAAATIPEAPLADPRVASHMGYAQAKWVCEKLTEEAAHLHPDRIDASVIRIGQVTGSTSGGVWSDREHVPAILKTARNLGCLPSIQGTLSWLPVDVIAAAIGDIALQPSSGQLVYHVENPSRQGWEATLEVLAQAMQTGGRGPSEEVLPLSDWIGRVEAVSQRSGDSAEEMTARFPATALVGFLRDDFAKLGTGNIVMSTEHAAQRSATLGGAGPVSDDLLRTYVKHWQTIGFL